MGVPWNTFARTIFGRFFLGQCHTPKDDFRPIHPISIRRVTMDTWNTFSRPVALCQVVHSLYIRRMYGMGLELVNTKLLPFLNASVISKSLGDVAIHHMTDSSDSSRAEGFSRDFVNDFHRKYLRYSTKSVGRATWSTMAFCEFTELYAWLINKNHLPGFSCCGGEGCKLLYWNQFAFLVSIRNQLDFWSDLSMSSTFLWKSDESFNARMRTI